MTWNEIVINYHSKYYKSIGVSFRTDAYIRSTVLKKHLKAFSLKSSKALKKMNFRITQSHVQLKMQLLKVLNNENNKAITHE